MPGEGGEEAQVFPIDGRRSIPVGHVCGDIPCGDAMAQFERRVAGPAFSLSIRWLSRDRGGGREQAPVLRLR